MSVCTPTYSLEDIILGILMCHFVLHFDFAEIVIASQSYISCFLCNMLMVVTQSFEVCTILDHLNTDHGFKSSLFVCFFFLLLVFLECTAKVEAVQWVDNLLKEFCRMSEKCASF